MAGLVGLEITDPQPGYEPSTTITIQLVASGFWQDFPYDSIGFMDIASISSDVDAIASNPVLHSKLAVGTGGEPTSSVGDIINEEGILIQDIRGYIVQGELWGPSPPANLYWFDLHIPDVPFSTIITITMNGLAIKNLGYNDPVPGFTATNTLEIHVIPEPMTIALLGLGGLFLRRRR